LGIFKGHKELGAPGMVFVTPACGLDLPYPMTAPHLRKMFAPAMVTGILSGGKVAWSWSQPPTPI